MILWDIRFSLNKTSAKKPLNNLLAVFLSLDLGLVIFMNITTALHF